MDKFSQIVGVNGRKPWDEALLARVRQLEAQLDEGRRQYALLLVENRALHRKVYDARRRLENWKSRQETWRREREILEAQLRAQR